MSTSTVSVVVPKSTAQTWMSSTSQLNAEEREAVTKALAASNGADSITLVVPKSWASRSDPLGCFVKDNGAVAAHGGTTKGTFTAPTLIDPPAFPTPDQLSGKTPEISMPPNAVAYVKKLLLGEQHARWHTTRDFAFSMQELSPTTAGPLLAAWKALRDAKLGVPSPNPPAGSPAVDPRQTAFVNAMKAFVAANPKSKDQGTKDVISAWAQIQKQNWPIPARSEGDPGNGLDFLTMHHEMILMMKHQLANTPEAMAALNGWSHFPAPAPWPYDPKDSSGGVAKATIAVNLLNEMIDASTPQAVAQFKVDFQKVTGIAFDQATADQFGLWIQSTAAGLPNSGIHNWMHNQYEVPKSKIEMDSFVLNVQNPHFWGLHGAIDNAFMKFLSLRGMSVDSPDVKADLAQQAAEMGMMVQPEMGRAAQGMQGMDMDMDMSLPRDQDGVALLPDGSKIPAFEKMSPELKGVIENAQKNVAKLGLMQ